MISIVLIQYVNNATEIYGLVHGLQPIVIERGTSTRWKAMGAKHGCSNLSPCLSVGM